MVRMPGRNQEDSPGISPIRADSAGDMEEDPADVTMDSLEASEGVPDPSVSDAGPTQTAPQDREEGQSESDSQMKAPDTPSETKLSNGNRRTNGFSESEGAVSPPAGGSENSSTPKSAAPTPQRPRRAAAAVANERMVLRKRPAATPDDKTLSPASSTPAKASNSSAPKKRRPRALDNTITSADASEVTHSPLMSVLKSRQRKAAAAVPVAAPNRKRQRVGEDDLYIRSLCGILRSGEMTIGGLVDSWVDTYKRDHLMGFLELANFFVHSSGCKGKIGAGMTKLAADEIMKQLTPKFEEDTNDYPLIRTDKEFKKFRSDFCKFLHTVVLAIKDTILFDDYLIDNLFRLLIDMADSGIRAFRHTATLGVMKILTGLVEVMVHQHRIVQNDQQQLEQEENRKRSNPQRVQMLERTLKAHRDQADKVKECFELGCKQVLYIRYRDTVSSIRELCMEEIGVWMSIYPERFVDDSYLKYLGWTLNDKEAAVRRKCLSAIYPLYETEENVARLQLFSSKFKDRFVQMATDVDTECCIRAGKILIAMNRSMPELFGEADLTRIFDLIYVADHNLAVSSAEILINHMTSVTAVDRQNRPRFKSGKEWSDDTFDLYFLIAFSVANTSRSTNQAYFVDSLIDVCPALKAWEAMTDLLLEEFEEGTTLQPLSDKEEKELITVMSYAIKQTATAEAPGGRSHVGRKRNKDAKQTKDEVTDLTTHFIDVLPKLISKYKQDPAKITFLISFPQYFDVDLYTTNHKEAELGTLLDLLCEIYEKYEHAPLLKAAVKSLDCLEREGSGIVNRVAIARTTILTSIVNKFQEAFPHWLAFNGDNDQELVYHMESSVKRLYALLITSDGSDLDIWDPILQTLERAVTLNYASICDSTIKCCMLLLFWKIRALQRNADGPDAAILEEHQKRFQYYVDVLLGVVADHDVEEIVYTAFGSVIDAVIVHQPQNDRVPDWFKNLSFQLSADQQSILSNYIDKEVLSKPLPDGGSSAAFNSVIVDKEKRDEVVYKRRKLLLQFVKAMSCAIILPRYASVVFKHAISSNMDYGDIIKETMKRLQEVNPVYFAECIAASLVEMFTGIAKKRRITRVSRDVLDIKDMAKRFAAYFGTDNVRSRSAMGALHKYCFEFIKGAASRDDAVLRIIFFDILSEFHSKLLRPDKTSLVNLLNSMDILKTNPGESIPSNDLLLPFLQYRNTLALGGMEGEPDDKHRRGRRINPPQGKKGAVLEGTVAEAESSEAAEAANLAEVNNVGHDDATSVAGSVLDPNATVEIEQSMDVV
ncbi:cohesin subunit SA-2-like [Paramacrobiotus metropolitanus]|uniref:cohesin subunit SA-2-like n=1 Tax=Paramacrobiotus metropolitanus TaxID=2943436 RepID=UPI002445B0FF|nr:cohesin subunit SA-2-like [Paramacrobiotus metropolitanus]